MVSQRNLRSASILTQTPSLVSRWAQLGAWRKLCDSRVIVVFSSPQLWRYGATVSTRLFQGLSLPRTLGLLVANAEKSKLRLGITIS